MTMVTMKELSEECAKLGITPGRSVAETEKRIADRRAAGSIIGTAINAAAREAAVAQQAGAPTRHGLPVAAWRALAAGDDAEAARIARLDRIARLALPREVSRTMRMLADCTAICGTLARNPLIYTGDEDRHDYAIMGGWLVAVALQVRGQWMARQPRPAARRFA